MGRFATNLLLYCFLVPTLVCFASLDNQAAKFQVALIRDDERLCGGTLISTSFVLTTDKCALKEIDVVVGSDDLLDFALTDVAYIATAFYVNDKMALIKLPNAISLEHHDVRTAWFGNLTGGDRLHMSGWMRDFDVVVARLPMRHTAVVTIDCAKCQFNDIDDMRGMFCVRALEGQGWLIENVGGALYKYQHNYELVGVAYAFNGTDAAILVIDSYQKWIENVLYAYNWEWK